jgi:hypothetical protein
MKIERAKFMVPYNWGEEYLAFIRHNQQHIDSVYGSLPGYPGGRPIPHTELPQNGVPTHERLSHVIGILENLGIQFHFTYNMSCTGNTFLTEAGRKYLDREIRSLRDLGVKHITVSNFGLARLISKINPAIELTMSVIPNITEVDQLLYLARQDFNCTGLVVGKGITRNLPKLASFIEFAKSINIAPTVIANDFCPTANCPERVTDHNNTCAHKHLPFNQHLGKQIYISPSLYCRQLVMKDPSLYLKAPTINPNDLPEYEEIGVMRFKLTDRVMPDQQIMKI